MQENARFEHGLILLADSAPHAELVVHTHTVRKLEAEALRYKQQMDKMRPGPAQNSIKQRALQVLKQKKCVSLACGPDKAWNAC